MAQFLSIQHDSVHWSSLAVSHLSPPAGFYADPETRCQVFHVCNYNTGIKNICPNGTIFSQEQFTCRWWNEVNCDQAESFYELNNQIGVVPPDSPYQPQPQPSNVRPPIRPQPPRPVTPVQPIPPPRPVTPVRPQPPRPVTPVRPAPKKPGYDISPPKIPANLYGTPNF